MGYVDPQLETFEVGKRPSPVTATANPGYQFMYWADRDGNKQFSTSATFTPEACEDGNYEQEYFAFFKEADPIPIPLPQTYTVTYTAVEGGSVDKRNEVVNKDELPKGVTVKAKENYFFKYFIVDKNVKLKTANKEVKAGMPLSEDEVKDIIVSDNLNIAAIFEHVRHFGTIKTKEGVDLKNLLEKLDGFDEGTYDITDDGGYKSNVSDTYTIKAKTLNYHEEGLVLWEGKIIVDEKPSVKANDVTVPFGKICQEHKQNFESVRKSL